MTWQTESEFESRPGVIRALYSTESNSVYYITEMEESEMWDGDGYVVNYWPNRNKTIETVTIVDSFEALEDAEDCLGEKTDSSKV